MGDIEEEPKEEEQNSPNHQQIEMYHWMGSSSDRGLAPQMVSKKMSTGGLRAPAKSGKNIPVGRGSMILQRVVTGRKSMRDAADKFRITVEDKKGRKTLVGANIKRSKDKKAGDKDNTPENLE
jgi:hypothetical protein